MDASKKYYFTTSNNGKSLDIPIEIKWDFYGRDDSIEIWETDAVNEVIGIPKDFEILRFAHDSYGQEEQTQLNYQFYFEDGNGSWDDSYLNAGFTGNEVYYRSNAFKKSFFKIDFYDTTDTVTQTNYFTVIIPSSIGETENVSVSSQLSNVDIKKPDFILDYVGNKEGFFLYWLRYKDFLDISTFYMTVKFFDAKNGVFVKMINVPQSSLSNPTLFDGSIYFYYKVVLNDTNKTYQIFDNNNTRIGVGSPIKWYEYINP